MSHIPNPTPLERVYDILLWNYQNIQMKAEWLQHCDPDAFFGLIQGRQLLRQMVTIMELLQDLGYFTEPELDPFGTAPLFQLTQDGAA